jgi:hypothetical protein
MVMEKMHMQDEEPSAFGEEWEEDEFDDVDALFSKLESFEPPEELVQQIMDAVSKLPPLSQLQHNDTNSIIWHDQNLPS